MKKLLSLLMSVAMIATMFTAFGLTASAETSAMTVNAIFVDGQKLWGGQDILEIHSSTPIFSWETTSSILNETQEEFSITIVDENAHAVLDTTQTSTLNHIVYDGTPLVDGTTYLFGMTLTDQNGNKTEAYTRRFMYTKVVNINPDSPTGDSNIIMNGATISTPTYTVTIPEKIEFGEVTKKVKAVSDADAIAKTAEYTVSVNHSYLFDNQKNITVTLTTDNKIKNGTNELAYDLFEKADTDTKITNDTVMFSIQPTASLVNETETKTLYATLDQRLIKASGDYTGTVTFTVSMADNK